MLKATLDAQWFFHPDVIQTLKGIKRGIEREVLRVTPEGLIAQTPHPRALGAALTHDTITTDYSEALIELITKPYTSIHQCLQALHQVHQFVDSQLENEHLWPQSMPPLINNELEVPIAAYGNSLIGQLKRIYREGLGLRYGRKMQTIAGIHYNLSLPDTFWQLYRKRFCPESSLVSCKNQGYFNLIRQFLKNSWMLTLMTGASPAFHESFIDPEKSRPQPFRHTRDLYYAPFGSSLRMGGIGYHNDAQSGLFICYDSLEHYIFTLTQAMQTPSAPLQKYGLYNREGERHQLSTNVLQIENEFYGNIRPKQIALTLERPTLALQRRGVSYVEIRNIDIDPYSPCGITPSTSAIIEIFVIGCLLEYSSFLTKSDNAVIVNQNELVTLYGRNQKLGFIKETLHHWRRLEPVAQALSDAYNDNLYVNSFEQALQQLGNPAELKSEQVLGTFQQGNDSYTEKALALSQAHRHNLDASSLDPVLMQTFQSEAKKSLATFEQLTPIDDQTLNQALQDYFKDLPMPPKEECTALSAV